ncbi:MAG: glycoside hydrolase family 3 N-terminal domain-containing protein [Ferruginibacter sp.]
MRFNILFLFLFFSLTVFGQKDLQVAAKNWADSVYKTLTDDERIAQLMVVRLSSIDLKTKQVTFYDEKVAELVKKYNIGGICAFQGRLTKQIAIINSLQAAAKTPILMCMDAEWGVGQRLLDSVIPLPKQMMLGAMKDPAIIYKYGKVVAEQCKRFGLQVDYAPVVDVNNNPDNPVINDRSFGEDKFKVSSFAIQYMKGLQDNGVMACAKHFPGHGDVAVDSHLDLPVIHKNMLRLDSLELYPFKQIFNAGVSSTMVAHLYIPSIDSTANTATSLSKNSVTGLLRNQLNFNGLTFTDALDMQGVRKFFPDGAASVQAIIAGNDMLCLPEDVPMSIKKINDAIAEKKLSRADIEMHCKKVLMAKYQYGLSALKPISIENLSADLNKDVPAMRRLVAENAITLLSKSDSAFFPLSTGNKPGDIAYIGIGLKSDNAFATRMRTDHNATVFYFDYSKKNDDSTKALIDSIVMGYKKVVIGIHNTNRPPLNNFGISSQAVDLINTLQQRARTITFLFANPYAAKNWCAAKNLVVCYEDDSIVQNTAIDLLQGKLMYKGVLPVTVCDNFHYGHGIVATVEKEMQETDPLLVGIDPLKLSVVDSIANDAIAKKAMPGCVVLVAKNGSVAFQKAYGYYTYDKTEPVTTTSLYDMASVTKICATTISVMKLYDEGKIDLKKKLSDYLPWLTGSNKADLVVEDILLHQAGLAPIIPFYKTTINDEGVPLWILYRSTASDSFPIPVAHNLFLRKDWKDSLDKQIFLSPVKPGQYVYSDIDFILLGKIVEAVSNLSLDEYVRKTFYDPMSLKDIGFKPLDHFPVSRIAPTENEKPFRQQLLRGDVHDPAAAMYGEIAGHAGLFSDAYDIACIMQMLLNGGTFNGKKYLQKETVDLFTSYHSNISRRGYGFDKPEKDNATREEPYPTKSASPLTFGHTGFTGTCAWADPASDLIFIFLSNRVYPEESKLFNRMNVRPKIHEVIYKAAGI